MHLVSHTLFVTALHFWIDLTFIGRKKSKKKSGVKKRVKQHILPKSPKKRVTLFKKSNVAGLHDPQNLIYIHFTKFPKRGFIYK